MKRAFDFVLYNINPPVAPRFWAIPAPRFQKAAILV
jgi:hypothetical protein